MTSRPSHLKSIFYFVLVSFLVSTASIAQEKKPVYLAFNYIKAKPGKGGKYVELIKNYSTKILSYAVEVGAFSGWYFYELRMPTGSATEYDFVAVSVVNDFKYLFEEPGTYADIMKKAIPGISDETLKTIADEFESSRISVKREIFTRTSDLVPNAVPAKYARVDYNLSAEGKEADYIKMETELMAPIHKEIVAMGAYNDWELYKKILPKDSKSDFDYIAVDFMNEINTIVNLNYSAIAKKTMPDVDLKNMWSTVGATRRVVRGEIWELVEYVDSKKKFTFK